MKSTTRAKPVSGVATSITANVAANAAKSQQTSPPAWLLTGHVMHERLRPKPHRFTYPVFYVRCDLDRLASLDSGWFGIDRLRPLSLHRRDHGPRDGSDLAAWMRAQLSAAGIEEADGGIWLQAFPRVFGYAFNPVSFWFCHDRDGHLRALLAEVRNTFGERHSYLLSARPTRRSPRHALMCRKVLHVSPFCRVEGGYAFRVREAGSASVSIDYHDADGLLIRTALGGRLKPLTRASACAALMRQPLLTVGVIVRIHWQALRLALKNAPFYGKHPAPARTADACLDHHAAGQTSAAAQSIPSD